MADTITPRSGSKSEDPKKVSLSKNLKKLEDKNKEIEQTKATLNDEKRKVKQHATDLRNEVARECELLTSIIERKKRDLVAEIGRLEKQKIKELDSQIMSSQCLLEQGTSLRRRADRQIQNARKTSNLALDKVTAVLDETVSSTIPSLMVPDQDGESFHAIAIPDFATVREEVRGFLLVKGGGGIKGSSGEGKQ